ncbi:MAG: NAD(P)-binding protein [Pseudomonadota bacterium]
MTEHNVTTDYLIIGAGAVGMAFADTLLSDSDADIIIIDSNHRPGGHWNQAYPFVQLHQPSAFYGVSSRELSNHMLNHSGFNEGLGHLASGVEILAYFESVMQERFLPSGRVRYFPMSDYEGDGIFRSILTGERTSVTVNQKFVDATYLKTTVPSTHTPSFKIGEDVRFIPINDLPKMTESPDAYVVIGGGKTGIDACLWLMENHVDPNLIRWIMPRDGWMIDRRNTQPTIEFFNDTLGSQAAQFEAIAAATSVEDLFGRLEQAGVLLRIDENVTPKMFHGATISRSELEALRRIKNIVRMGRVSELKKGEIILDEGNLEVPENSIHIDCSASAISNLETKPIFQDNLITPQTVRSYQPVFSASVIAHVEATRETEKEKNQLCGVVQLPNHDTDWLRMMVPFMMNQYQWSSDPEMREWLKGNRLDGFSAMVRSIDKEDAEKQAIMTRMRESAMPAMGNLHKLIAELDAS